MPAANQRVRFSKRSIEALKPGEKRYFAYDVDTRGLAVAVLPTGKRVFYVYAWMHGRPEQVRIGDFPTVSVENARKAARAMLGDVATGKNPAEAKRRQRGELTLGEVWASFVAYTQEHRRATTAAEYAGIHRQYLKAWNTRPLNRIERRDVAALHQRIGRKAPLRANRTVALVSRLYGYASETFDYAGLNPAKHVRRFPERSRERFVGPDEMAAFFEAVEAEPSETWRDFFKLAIFTGARRSNLQRMAWADIDLRGRAWDIPGEQSKNGKPLRVVLPDPAVEILKRRKADAKAAQDTRPHVFPSWGASGHIEEPKKPWAALVKRAGLTDLRFHDLRRSLGSWQAMTGAGLPIIGRSLGHLSQQSTAVYARLADEPVRQSVGKAVAAMLAAATARSANDEEPQEASD